jgi:hypothetical protein
VTQGQKGGVASSVKAPLTEAPLAEAGEVGGERPACGGASPLVWIHKRTGVMHADRACKALELVVPNMLREEAFDPSRPRHCCSRCWRFSR